MRRADFAAFEWSVNEITDNVLVHSDSSVGGLVQVSTFRRMNKQVQFVVADPGQGIPESLRAGRPEISSDTEALDEAIKEGVTRDKRVGQGNGLFGSYQICSHCDGTFIVMSGHASLRYERSKLSIGSEKIPFAGTLVVVTIDFTRPKLLEEALRFGGRKHSPLDFVEVEYEEEHGGNIRFRLQDESPSFGSRVAGAPVRTKLSNLMHMRIEGKVVVDFEGVPLVSSSFADEAFGKLLLAVGPMEFLQTFEFVNMMGTVRQIVNRAMTQRMMSGTAC